MMVETFNEQDSPLRILHVLRAPLGGLFRHVLDLTREQVARGHAVGLVTDSLTGGDTAVATLAELAPQLKLGVTRVPVHRNPHPSDVAALAHVMRRIRETQADVVHGHGSKGGVLARCPGFFPWSGPSVRAYTPHGGSLNHQPGTRTHTVYMKVEAALQQWTDLILFESGFIASRYRSYVGHLPRLNRVVHNGIADTEFTPVPPSPDATDFLYVGELRFAKGIDTLLLATARAGELLGRVPSLTLVGSGPDRVSLEQQAAQLGLGDHVVFRSQMPARRAFSLGRTLVVPSRAESLPYVVLEAAGACVPMIATNVGGIPEIFGPARGRLIPSDSVPCLTDRLIEALTEASDRRVAAASALSEYVHDHFSIAHMVNGVLAGYREALLRRRSSQAFGPQPAVALSS